MRGLILFIAFSSFQSIARDDLPQTDPTECQVHSPAGTWLGTLWKKEIKHHDGKSAVQIQIQRVKDSNIRVLGNSQIDPGISSQALYFDFNVPDACLDVAGLHFELSKTRQKLLIRNYSFGTYRDLSQLTLRATPQYDSGGYSPTGSELAEPILLFLGSACEWIVDEYNKESNEFPRASLLNELVFMAIQGGVVQPAK